MAEIQEISRREQKTVYTNCIITFDCGCTKEVDIPHFMPQNENDIMLGCNNRLISEQREFKCEVIHE